MNTAIQILTDALASRKMCIRTFRKDSEQAKRCKVEIEDIERALRKLEE